MYLWFGMGSRITINPSPSSVVTEVVEKCPFCNSFTLVLNDRGEVVCTRCGTVVSDHPVIQFGNFIRGFDGNKTTYLLYSDEAIVNAKSMKQYPRILDLLKSVEKRLGLGETHINRIYRLFMKFVEKYRGSLKRSTMEKVVAAITYYVLNTSGHAITFREIAVKLGLARSDVFKAYKMLIFIGVLRSVRPDPVKLAVQYASKLGYSDKAVEVRMIVDMLRREMERKGVTASSSSIASASVYLLNKVYGRNTVREVEEVVGKKSSTFRSLASLLAIEDVKRELLLQNSKDQCNTGEDDREHQYGARQSLS